MCVCSCLLFRQASSGWLSVGVRKYVCVCVLLFVVQAGVEWLAVRGCEKVCVCVCGAFVTVRVCVSV